MAADDQTEEQNENVKDTRVGKKRIALLALAGLLIVALSVGGTLVAVKLFGPDTTEESEQAPASGEALPKPAIYYPIKPPITASFSVRGRQRYLQAEITLMMREDDALSAVELHQPMLRNALVMIINGATYEEIQTAEGKELLRQQCLQELRRLLEQEIGKPGIEQVLFTNFVMQ